MVEREKVIDGLESLKKRLYDSKNILDGGIVGNALALLKAQEPRVMTYEEVCAWNYELVLEIRGDVLRWASPYRDFEYCGNTYYRLYDADGKAIDLAASDYNINWRCWKTRLLVRLRRETPWQ